MVCVGSAWDYDPTSKHHIMRAFSQHNEILWMDYHGTRRPEVSSADFRAGWSAMRRFVRGTRTVAPRIRHFTPLVIPGCGSPLLSGIHQRLLIMQIRRALRCVPGYPAMPVQIWSFAPDVPYLVGQFNEECFVYYCVDEYRAFEGLNSVRIAEAEDRLVQRADLVVTTSEPLQQARQVQRSDVVLMRHGVDYDHFAQAWRTPPPLPQDLAAVRKPIFGFFGLIHHWTDLALLEAVARLRPNYSFVLLGDCRIDAASLKGCENVVMLGRRPYAELPAYCAAFDAGMLLFKRTAMTRNINPIKMYEYLAAGLPVISTSLPEAERFRGPIRFADDPEGFAQACDSVLAENHAGRRESISRVVAQESWPSKIGSLSEHVLDRVRKPSRSASATQTGRGGVPQPMVLEESLCGEPI